MPRNAPTSPSAWLEEAPADLKIWPQLRRPYDHASSIAEWMELCTPIGSGGRVAMSLFSAYDWLALAAGLSQVKIIDHITDDFMCSGDEEKLEATSMHATEATRLLYVYCAFENLVNFIWPSPSSSRAILPVAVGYLGKISTTVPYLTPRLSHLRRHVDRDPVLQSMEKIVKAFSADNGVEAAVAARVGVHMRHAVAHGSRTASVEPINLVPDEDSPGSYLWRHEGHDQVCISTTATTCLLIAIQFLLRKALEKLPDFDHQELLKARVEEWWLPGANGEPEGLIAPTPDQCLSLLHLGYD